MKARVVFTFILGILVAGFAFAGDTQPMDVETLNETYEAPKLKESVRPNPVYYTMHREVEGYVTLEILVNEEGEVDQAKVKYSTSELAVKNALEAVSQWEFEAATVSGTPVKSWVAYNLPFGRALSIYEDAKYAKKVIVEDITYALAVK